MNYHKFDIVVSDFHFIEDVKFSKIRPAVIVSSDDYNKKTGFVVLAMITSARHSVLWQDLEISDYENTDLKPTSVIRMKFSNCTQSKILQKIGKLSQKDQKNLTKKLKNIF